MEPILYRCDYCEKEFELKSTQHKDTRHYCSKKCVNESRRIPPYLYRCDYCEKEFELTKTQRLRNNLRHFCSRRCEGKYNSNNSLHLDKNWLYQKYIVEGLSIYQIAKIVGRDPKNVYNKLKDFGISTRSRAEALLGNSWWALGLTSALIGRHLTESTKKKISKTKTGKNYPALSGENNGMYGKKGELHPNWGGWRNSRTPEII